MTGRELITLTRASRKGRRIVVRDECKLWLKNHQQVLRAAFKYPDDAIDLTDGMSHEELVALGGERLERGYGLPSLWTCSKGDEELARRILGLSDDRPPVEAGRTKPEIREGRYPGSYVITRHRTDDNSQPVYKGAKR